MRIARDFYLAQIKPSKRNVPDNHIIAIALDGIENEELRDPHKLYENIKKSFVVLTEKSTHCLPTLNLDNLCFFQYNNRKFTS